MHGTGGGSSLFIYFTSLMELGTSWVLNMLWQASSLVHAVLCVKHRVVSWKADALDNGSSSGGPRTHPLRARCVGTNTLGLLGRLFAGAAWLASSPLCCRRHAYWKLILLCVNAIILPKLNIKPKPIMFHRVGIGVIYSWVELPSISVIAFNYDWYVSAHQSITNCHYVILLSLI